MRSTTGVQAPDERQEPDERESHSTRMRHEHFPEWKVLVSLAFVTLSLIALVLVPLLFDRRIRPLRTDVVDVIEPSRVLVARIEGVFARQVALLRGYLLTRDARMLEEYRRLVEQEQTVYGALAPLIERLGPAPGRTFVELRTEARAWQENFQDLAAVATPDEVVRAIPRRQERFDHLIDTVDRLEQVLLAEERGRRQQILRLSNLSRWISVALVMMAAISVGIVAALGRHLGQRTRVEQALRRVSSTLTGALSIGQIMRLVAAQTRHLTRADGVYIERIDAAGAVVEVIASVGDTAPPAGTRAAYPGSLTEEVVRDGQPRSLSDITTIGPSMAPYLAESCKECSGLVVPLVAGTGITLGALVALRRRGSFSEEDLALTCTLGDLAALASRKVLLIEEAERRRAEVEELAATKARLIRGISHDLKNPIGALDGYAELLEMGVKGQLNPDQLAYVQRIRRGGHSMLEIIEGLLELARTESGQIAVECRPTDVARVALEAAEDYRASIHVAGMELDIELPQELPVIETDAKRVRAILGNLLSNAIKYTPAGSRVTVRAAVRSGGRAPGEGDWVTVDVVDTGCGIPVEDQERIFEEFQRLEPDRARGAGIGLAISRRIARLLGGDLTVRSVPGEGSTFSLWLPRT